MSSRVPVLVLTLAILVVAVMASPAQATVYWGNGSSIGAGSNDGSAADPAYIEGIGRACGVAVTATHIFWADVARNQIGRANLDGSEPVPALITGASEPCGVAASNGRVYWANRGGTSIGRANINGTEVDQFFLPGINGACGVTVREPFIYWGSFEEDSIGRALTNLEGIAQKDWIPTEDPCGIAVSESHIYWGTFDDSIGRADFNGDNPNENFISGLDSPSGVALHGPSLFWAEEWFSGGVIGTALLDGSAVNRGHFSGLASPSGIAVDSLPFAASGPVIGPPLAATFLRIKDRPRRRPTTFIKIAVPKAGDYSIKIPRGIGWTRVGEYLDEARLERPGVHWFNVWLQDTRKGRILARVIKRRGRFKFPFTFTYAAEGHSPSVQSKRVVLRRWPKPNRTKTRAPR
jgi:hypothetical protein